MEGDDVGARVRHQARVVWLTVFRQVSRNSRFPSGGARRRFRERISVVADLTYESLSYSTRSGDCMVQQALALLVVELVKTLRERGWANILSGSTMLQSFVPYTAEHLYLRYQVRESSKVDESGSTVQYYLMRCSNSLLVTYLASESGLSAQSMTRALPMSPHVL